MGLKNEVILRRAWNGNEIYETIFSQSNRYLDFYRRRFSGSVHNRSAFTQRIEDFLFGYPSCCVQRFIHRPYQPNFLDKNHQRKLFHWACPHYRVTSELLPYYLSIQNRTLEWYRQEFICKKKGNEHRYHWLSAAATLGILLTTGATPAQVIPNSTHWLPISPDVDNDYLADFKEVYLGSNFFTTHTRLGVSDNIYWTQSFKSSLILCRPPCKRIGPLAWIASPVV